MENITSNGRYLLCMPHYFDVTYEINAWMNKTNRPDKQRAYKQWCTLNDTLIQLGVRVEYVEGLSSCPDMVFTANAGLVRNNKVILSGFRFLERQGEEPSFRSWFQKNGFEVHEHSKGCFEGEGDALVAGDVLFAGYGFRSDKEVYDQVKAVLGFKDVICCELIHPNFYHFDTCFCPLNENVGFFYPSAFTEESQDKMKKALELFEVPEDEAFRFACNTIVLDHEVVMPTGCPKTMSFVRSHGFNPYPIEIDEYLKAGGACKCLALKL